MKKFVSCLIAVAIAISPLSVSILRLEADTSARSAVVMDVQTGRVLYAKNMQEKRAMASTTKIMTTLVAIESGKLGETVKVDQGSTLVEGSSIYLKAGEQQTVENLLFGVMLRSGNDAALAVATHVGGSIPGFVEMMNRKASEIGAKDTHFANPHGLDASDHYTTAYDLALIASHALRNAKFAEIVRTKSKTIPGPPDVSWSRTMINKNKMLWQLEGGDGVKTGYTGKAGRCLVSSATRNGMQLVCVVLDCGPMWEDSTALLEYGFKNFALETVIRKDKVAKVLNVKDGKSDFVSVKPSAEVKAALSQGEKEKLVTKTYLQETVKAPIHAGDEAGKLEVYLNDVLLGSVMLVYCESIESSSPLYHIKRIFSIWFQ